MAKNDGGPAFPLQEQMQPAADGGNAWFSPGQPGMSLRDYFAGQALVMLGIHADIAGADAAYRIADAMIAQREK